MRILILLIAFSSILLLGKVRKIDTPSLYFAPPKIIRYFTLGYNDFVANLLWLRFLQDADFCSFEEGKPVYTGKKRTCEFGWSYRMADAITELAPRFKTPYTISSVLMSVFSGDIVGSEKILLKGVKQFPKDWLINFYTAYLYSVDLNKPRLAARYAYQAAVNGGPYWLYSYAAKQYSTGGKIKLGEAILTEVLKTNLSKEKKAQIRKHLQKIREDNQ